MRNRSDERRDDAIFSDDEVKRLRELWYNWKDEDRGREALSYYRSMAGAFIGGAVAALIASVAAYFGFRK